MIIAHKCPRVSYHSAQPVYNVEGIGSHWKKEQIQIILVRRRTGTIYWSSN
jgi:hypothetical protein